MTISQGATHELLVAWSEEQVSRWWQHDMRAVRAG